MSTSVLQIILWHAKRLYRTTFNSASPTISQGASMTGAGTSLISRPDPKPSGDYLESPSRTLLREAAISRAIKISANVDDSEATFIHCAEATRNVQWVTGLHLRRLGDRLGKDDLRALGVRGNSIVTRQYIDILNASGLANAMLAADDLAMIINVGACSGGDILSQSDARGFLKFLPGSENFPACPVAEMRGTILVHKSDATLLPLQGCSHPGKCWCRYRHPATDMGLAYEFADAFRDDPETARAVADLLMNARFFMDGDNTDGGNPDT